MYLQHINMIYLLAEPPQRNYGEGFTVRRRKRQCLHTILVLHTHTEYIGGMYTYTHVCSIIYQVSQCSVDDNDQHHILWRSLTNSHQNSNPSPCASRTNFHSTSRSVCSHRCHSNVASTVIIHALSV